MRPTRALMGAALSAVTILLLSAAPTLAADAKPTQITVWCSADDKSANTDIEGIVTVPDGSHGDLDLRLLGSKVHHGDDSKWQATGQTTKLTLVRGQTTYTFHFNVTVDNAHFVAYRIGGGADGMSREIERDECGFRVPEAPAPSLLLLAGGVPAVAWLAIRRRANLPRLPFHRAA